ncbi:hypothetical protein HYC85_002791 [Camellia sinensis]|uniref:F-box domain-containing protein n=1 Tax=Camellia sinensis TaxID=4442 RepID=A0A7J7I9B4_CAMSI|nr:hypothetical protein HYC85_002791 [Camellia sinensis]
MVKGKERERETEDEEETERFDEYCYSMSKNGELYKGCWVSSGSPSLEKMKTCKTTMGSGPNWLGFSSCDGSDDGTSGTEPQDADYSYIPSLDYELESQILARIPRSEYWKLCLVNRRCLTLLKSGELFKIRRELGVRESSVLMAPIGENSWWAYDTEFKTRRKLPNLQTDFCFVSGDKESFCAGTHLLVSGREVDGLVTWRYELAMNRWYKGPSMITPRCLFASATCGTFAFIAGGVGIEPNSEVYDTAEKYNPETKSWEPLQRMKRKRKLCSGCYMDNKFYVIGGRNADGELTCGEFFDEGMNRWNLIPDMLKDDPVLSSHSPPLVAVVNNELYSLETSSNQLKVYVKSSNTWKQLGPVPVRADFNKGWGVAFKSLGNELLVIGAPSDSGAGNCMAIYTCCPDLDANELQWRLVNRNRNQIGHFILNCSVMVA